MNKYKSNISTSIVITLIAIGYLIFISIRNASGLVDVIIVPLVMLVLSVLYSNYKECEFEFLDGKIHIDFNYFIFIKMKREFLFKDIKFAQILYSTGSTTSTKILFYLRDNKRITCPISALDDMHGFITDIKGRVHVIELDTPAKKWKNIFNRFKSDFPLKGRDF